MTGWYLGLGGGYASENSIVGHGGGPLHDWQSQHVSDGGIVAGSFGYKWESGFRIEDEVGYSSHDPQVRQRRAVWLKATRRFE